MKLVGVDDFITKILWTKLFLEEQGYEINKNVLYQDNKSAILLETNGKKSSGKRTRTLNLRYFFVTDQTEKGNLTVEHCPTEDMVADHMTKPLQGKQFDKLGVSSWDMIAFDILVFGCIQNQQECVGSLLFGFLFIFGIEKMLTFEEPHS